MLSHHVVIRDGKIANYHPYPPTPWNASPRDVYGTPGPYEDAVQNTPIFEENGPDKFKGIDIMRTVRSFDPCLPCGVHMYLGDGKVLDVRHVADVRRAEVTRAAERRGDIGRQSMTDTFDAREFQARLQRLDALLQAVERFADPAAQAQTREIVQAVLDLHGAGLERILEHHGRRRARPAPRPSTPAPATTWSGACSCSTGCTPWTSRRACGRPSSRCGPTSARTAATSSCSGVERRRRPAAAAGKLPRLPVVGRDPEADDRGGDPRPRPPTWPPSRSKGRPTAPMTTPDGRPLVALLRCS